MLQSKNQVFEQTLASFHRDRDVVPILDIACGHPDTATYLTTQLSQSHPHLAMYLAACSRDDELYNKHLEGRLSQSGLAMSSGLLAMLQWGTVTEKDKLIALSEEDSLVGVLSRYILTKQETD